VLQSQHVCAAVARGSTLNNIGNDTGDSCSSGVIVIDPPLGKVIWVHEVSHGLETVVGIFVMFVRCGAVGGKPQRHGVRGRVVRRRKAESSGVEAGELCLPAVGIASVFYEWIARAAPIDKAQPASAARC